MSIRYRFLIPLLSLLLASLACRTVIGSWDAVMALSPTSPSEAAPSMAALQTIQLAKHTQTATLPPPTFTATPLPPSPTFTPSATPLPPIATSTPLPSATQKLFATLDPGAAARQAHIFEEVWGVVDENYLYPDFNGLDWNAVRIEYLERIQGGLSDDEFYMAMAEMVSRLGDEHSVYFSPEQAAEVDAEYQGDYDYVGIGVMSVAVPGCDCITLILVFPGGPAGQAGLQAHDRILAVDGQPILDENGLRRDLLRGPEGSSIQLTVRSPGGEPRQVSMIRQRISGPLPVPYQVLATPNGKRVGYIFIYTFNDSNIDDGVGDALEAMSAAGQLDGLILDVRQNGGGSSEILANTLAYFTDGVVGHFVERTGQRPLSVPGRDYYGTQHIPLVVLVGTPTASFGEVFAGILKDMGRAFLIGEQTDGNVEILNVFNFSDGSRAWIAQGVFRPLNHPEQDWEQTGITPDLVIPVNWIEVTLDSDPPIQSSLKHFDG